MGKSDADLTTANVECQICRQLLLKTCIPLLEALKKSSSDALAEAGEASTEQSSILKQRLKFLQRQEGIENTNKGRRKSSELPPLHQKLGAWLDGRRAGVYKKLRGTLLKCWTCNTVFDAVRESTIFWALQHECSDALWHVFHKSSPAELSRPACNGVPLLDAAGGTRAHEELPSFEVWLAHGAPWHVSIGHRCKLQDRHSCCFSVWGLNTRA